MPQYKVLAKNNISKSATLTEPARWLEPGEVVEMDERTAREEFAGRLATMDGQVVRKDAEADALAALTVVLTVRRPHERVSLIQDRLATTPADDPTRPRLEAMLAEAERGAAEDQTRHEARATAGVAAEPAESPKPIPVPPPTSAARARASEPAAKPAE